MNSKKESQKTDIGKARMKIVISGLVQGVFFRAQAQEEAMRRGLYGWVRNLPDGKVEVIAEGETGALASLVSWCRQGSPYSRVERVDVAEEPYRGEFIRFDIKH